MAHQCDLHGTFATGTHFVRAKYFTAYNNRLSGALPETLLNTSIINESLVLPSNLFKIDDEPPDWLTKSSHFLSVKSMYITSRDEKTSFILLCLCGVISIINVLLPHLPVVFKQHDILKRNSTVLESFFQTIAAVLKEFDNAIIWLIAILYCFAYYFNSTYFSFGTITHVQQISISFYRSEHITWDWIVVILWIAYFSVLGHLILKLQNTMRNRTVTPSQDRTQFSESTLSGSTTTHKLLRVALYSSLFLLCNGFVVLSVICDNLPDHNIFNMQQYVITWV
eukprot:1009891_1